MEELLIRGLPVTKMSNKRFTGISDLEPLSLAWYALPAPTMGAALLAALLPVCASVPSCDQCDAWLHFRR